MGSLTPNRIAGSRNLVGTVAGELVRKETVEQLSTSDEFPPGQHLGLVRIRPQEREPDHSRNRHVEPYGIRPTCNSAVHREPARQREKERGEDHREGDDRKNYVAG